MKKDKRYTKEAATKLMGCLMRADGIDNLSVKEARRKCYKFLYPNTPSLFK